MTRSRLLVLGTLPAVLLLAPGPGTAFAAPAATGVSAIPGSAAATGWRVVATAGGKSHPGWMETVVSVGRSDAWAFGALTSKSAPDYYAAIVRHWNGRSWRPEKLPGAVAAALSGFPSTVAAGSSPKNVWAFTGSGAWVRFNGKHWSHGELPVEKPDDDGDITSAVVLGPHDVWALGYYNPVSPLPYIAHYNGHHWALTNLYLDTAIVAASALGPHNIWAAGADNTNVVLHYNGHAWTERHLPSALTGPAYFQGIVALSSKSVWVTGDLVALGGSITPGALHWNGHGWRRYPLRAPDPLINATADGHGGIWAVAQQPGAAKPFRPELWHFTHGRWLSSHIRGSDPADFIDQFAAVPGTSSVWAVGLFKSGGLDLPAILLDGQVPRLPAAQPVP